MSHQVGMKSHMTLTNWNGGLTFLNPDATLHPTDGPSTKHDNHYASINHQVDLVGA
jgi:hypothetical protein